MGDLFGYKPSMFVQKTLERDERMEKYYLDKAIEYLKYSESLKKSQKLKSQENEQEESEIKKIKKMRVSELASNYADEKVSSDPRNLFKNYSLDKQKELTRFDGYDVEQAYEDGMLEAIRKIEFAMSLGSNYIVSLNAIKECIKNLKEPTGDDI